MQDRTRKIALIDTVLGDEGLLRYTAVKNRFASEEVHTEPGSSFLSIYAARPSSVESTTIFSYKENLQKLRKKIEEHRARILQSMTNDTNMPVLSLPASLTVIDTVTIEEEEVVPAEKKSKEAEITQPVQNISLLSSLESFQTAKATGNAQMMHNKKMRAVSLLLESTMLKTTLTSPKMDDAVETVVDLTSSSLFLFIVPPRRFFSCFAPQAVKVPMMKETQIVNITKASSTTYEIILKNTNTGSFDKEITNVLSFTLLDLYNREYRYTVPDVSNYIKWLLAMKIRMHTVDSWDKKDFLESIRK